MTDHTVKVDAPVIPIGFSFQCQLDERRILTAQTHIDQNADKDEINAVLDKVADAVDRMKARYRKRELDEQLVRERRLRQLAIDGIARIDKKVADDYAAQVSNGRRSPAKLSPADAAAKQNVESTIIRHDEMIGDVEREIAQCAQMLNGAGA